MTLPSATYRIQFRNGMTFDRAAALVPYLKNLGISHLYASPIFNATSGSTHGYDVTDANEIDPAIGGRAGFERLCDALKAAGLGLILDIVPNHMAASLENPWWRSVLESGAESRYSRHFDIDWSERLTLPQLGKSFDEALAAGEIGIRLDEVHGNLALAYFDDLFPLNAESQQAILRRLQLPDAADLRSISGNTASLTSLQSALDELSRDEDFIRALHDDQHWKLCYWKEASEHLTYRRFFEVAGLVGVRVEDAHVFADTHRLIIDLVRSGKVQGLRIDHIDGLADPEAYLQQLRREVGPDIYIVVEKILGHGETLPGDWPVAGTTGYEFILALSHVFMENEGLKKLAAAYFSTDGQLANYDEGLRAAKLLMVTRNFAGEVERLLRLAKQIHPTCDANELATAIREMLIAFPVYRTYVGQGEISPSDQDVLDGVIDRASREVAKRDAVDLLSSILSSKTTGAEAQEFRTRFQQLSGPVMAKAMEDTLFYRHNRLLALNEVGGEPDEETGGTAEFHRLMIARAEQQPNGLSSTSTHDTKRGEDARARLYALGEGADIFASGVERWRRMNKAYGTTLQDGAAPEPGVEWMLYQALAGVWPEDFDRHAAEELSERFVAYAEKAIREAKLRSDWADQNDEYEAAIKAYAAALVSPDNRSFIEDFSTSILPFIRTGYLNSLSQTLIKLTAPGIPDVYQGAEAFDFSLVDPDNRRPVDHATLEQWLRDSRPIARLPVPALKQRIIATVLARRRGLPQLFTAGNYMPLEIEGIRQDHVVAFARRQGQDFAITVVPRLMFGRLHEGMLFAGPEFWGDTAIKLPQALEGAKGEILTASQIAPGLSMPVAPLLGEQPVALLVGTALENSA